ncbi:hypothetical protein [Pelagibacterium mangrovi]|uniref:hypothetical protein n=1 Tax=Pelagibacterium mangrovi TaxID=3119828 RepID=UPI002FC7ECD9
MRGIDGKDAAAFYHWPSDEQVAQLWRTHGMHAVLKRWGFLTPRTLQNMRKRHLDRQREAA